jgi:hypothetical protein
LNKTVQRITFTPPLVEPEDPPTKNKRKSQNWAVDGQRRKSVVENPVVEIMETA